MYGCPMTDTQLPPPAAEPATDPAANPATDATTAETSVSRNVVTELFATTVLMLAGPGVLVLSTVGDLGAALSFGIALALAIGVIGAVANPMLTLSLLVVKEISVREAVGDWIGQVAGGVLGAALIFGINDLTRSSSGANGWDRAGLSTSSGLGAVMAAELVFGIMLVVVFLSAISQGVSKSAIAAFTGGTYAVAHLVLIGFDGGGLNPARSIGSAIFSDADPNALAQLWPFVVVPLVAAVAGVFVWLAIDDADLDDTIFDETFVDDVHNRVTGDTH
jgi:aquaporin Z